MMRITLRFSNYSQEAACIIDWLEEHPYVSLRVWLLQRVGVDWQLYLWGQASPIRIYVSVIYGSQIVFYDSSAWSELTRYEAYAGRSDADIATTLSLARQACTYFRRRHGCPERSLAVGQLGVTPRANDSDNGRG